MTKLPSVFPTDQLDEYHRFRSYYLSVNNITLVYFEIIIVYLKFAAA